jgi:tRNA pseudouridine55 synthase
VNGLLLLDKPPGITSHDAVNRVRRLFQEKSVGHLGTLDPLASGLLPLLLGKYTRLAQYFGKQQKEYEGRIRFGFATDTYDSQGAPTSEPAPVALDESWLRSAIASRQGTLAQTPPPFSAKKVQGVPAYKLARKGQSPNLQPVEIQIDWLRAEIVAPDAVEFRVSISAGGYIRSLAHDLGQQLGCGAHLAELRRIRAGHWKIADAITLDALADCDASARQSALLQGARVLPEIPAMQVSAGTVAHLRNGMQVNLPDFSQAPLLTAFSDDGEIVAIVRRMAGTLFAPQTVLA